MDVLAYIPLMGAGWELNLSIWRGTLRHSAVSRVVILPYKGGSRSARLLAQGLSAKLGVKVRRVRPDGRYRPRQRSLIINYGSNATPAWLTPVNKILNSPASCVNAGNKLRAFQLFKQHGVSTPEWTSLHATALEWIQGGAVVVCRTLLNAHSGRGIVLANTGDQLVNAPLYVKYKKKLKEYRVHVFQGQVIDVSEKRKRLTNVVDRFDGQIRNLNNGWVFCRDGISEPVDLRSLSVSACAALNLDFGAVDVIYNGKDNKCYVLEVNTAPGLVGTTLTKYIDVCFNWTQRN